jgi:hypothetical protein
VGYEDPAKNFSRILAPGDTDDGDPGLVGADIGGGPFASEEALISLATDGQVFWDLGFTGPGGTPAPGEGWEAQTPDDFLVVRNIPLPNSGGTVNFALNVTTNFLGPILGNTPSTFGGVVDVNASSNVFGVLNTDTPFDFFNNLDAFLLPEEPVCCIDIVKEVALDQNNPVWYDANTCADDPLPVPSPAVALENVLINDTTLGITDENIGTLAPQGEMGDSVILAGLDISQLAWMEDRCVGTQNIENVANATGTCADPVGGTESDEDPACWECEEQELGACRMTGGQVRVKAPVYGTDGLETFDYELVYPIADVARSNGNGDCNGNRCEFVTTGGQINAPSDGCFEDILGNIFCGSWEHTQHNGSQGVPGNFSFHSGTSSAPPGTGIIDVKCNDPGWCENARCAPFSQIFWTGIGYFQSQHFDVENTSSLFDTCVDPGKPPKDEASLHLYRVMIADNGETQNPEKKDFFQDVDPLACNWCPKQGDETDPPSNPQTVEALCFPGPYDAEDAVFIGSSTDGKFPEKDGKVCDRCEDYYQIKVYCDNTCSPDGAVGNIPACNSPADNPVIYEFFGFITLDHGGGNYQIHPETGDQCPLELAPESTSDSKKNK